MAEIVELSVDIDRRDAETEQKWAEAVSAVIGLRVSVEETDEEDVVELRFYFGTFAEAVRAAEQLDVAALPFVQSVTILEYDE